MGNEASKKTRKSGKTLETAKEAGYFGKKMLKSALKAGEEGRPTGWSMVTWWQGELIAKAMDVELVFPENYGAFCAAVRQAEPHLEIAGSEGFPNTLCGYARNCIGYTKLLADNNFVPPENAPGDRFSYLKDFVKYWNVNGVFGNIIRNCDIHGYEVPAVKDYLEGLGLPVLIIEQDYSTAAFESLRTRFQAFAETFA